MPKTKPQKRKTTKRKPAKQTKKRRIVKKTIKSLRRKKTTKTIKKKGGVNLAKNQLTKIEKSLESILAEKIWDYLPAEQPRKEKPVQNQNSQIIKQTNPQSSPHVLDLKQLEKEKIAEQQMKNGNTNAAVQELFKKLEKKKKILNNKLSFLYNGFQEDLSRIKQVKPEKIKIKTNTQVLPKIKLPKLKLPKIKLPQITLPSIKLPKISLPSLNIPKIKLPQIKLSLPKLKPIEINLGEFIMPTYWKRTILSFIVFSLIFILPFSLYGYYQNLEGKKNTILEKTAQALYHLTISQKAASAQDLYYTQLELQAATKEFSEAKNELEDLNFIVKEIIKFVPSINKKFITAQNLINIGESLSASGVILTNTIDNLNLDGSLENLNLTDKIIRLNNSLNLILPDIKEANKQIQELYIEEIPKEYHNKIQKLQIALPVLEKNIEKFISSDDLILQMLGHEHKMRYLFLFQNNHEIRPTGGFIGSYALVDIDQGNIEKISIPGGGPYDLKAGLKVNIESPRPLHIMNPRWEFQDANWFADLPTSAEKLLWFYDNCGGPTVDGLIFINASFLENILGIVGPIELPEYNKIITKDNFFQEVQKSVEVEYDREENKPKQIIADLTPKLINNLLSSDKKQFTAILDILLQSLNEKEIQLYFTDYSLEKLVIKNNWGGQMKDSDDDYLNIVSTNIAGSKSDAKIDQTANLQIDIKEDGTIINTLTITKTHNGIKGETFYGAPNLDYLRIYVPSGSNLIESSGFASLPHEVFTVIDPEIYQNDPDLLFIETTKEIDPLSRTEIYSENNKTVFANWFRVEPGMTGSVVFKYKLPFKLNFEKSQTNLNYLDIIKQELNLSEKNNLEKYSLLWQKQSGKNNLDYNLKINFPYTLNYQLIYPNEYQLQNKELNFKNKLNADKLFAIIFSQL